MEKVMSGEIVGGVRTGVKEGVKQTVAVTAAVTARPQYRRVAIRCMPGRSGYILLQELHRKAFGEPAHLERIFKKRMSQKDAPHQYDRSQTYMLGQWLAASGPQVAQLHRGLIDYIKESNSFDGLGSFFFKWSEFR
jgi:hypothetical protein